MTLKEHLRNHKFNIMWSRAHPQQTPKDMHMMLWHMANQTDSLNAQTRLSTQSQDLLKREVEALENIAILIGRVVR